MNIQDIVTAISTVGFPIVMCAALFWYMIQQREAHKSEMQELTNAVTNNTLVIQKLIDKLGDSNVSA